jgi:hypothetical protein
MAHPASPAKVYPASEERDRWMVEPPRTGLDRDVRAFSGPNAQVMALGFAFERYGQARVFSWVRQD